MQLVFFSTFNALYMSPNIRCDKIFENLKGTQHGLGDGILVDDREQARAQSISYHEAARRIRLFRRNANIRAPHVCAV